MTDDFELLRPFLIGVAYSMLGSFAEAEDVVQDAFLRWSARDRRAIIADGVALGSVVTGGMAVTRRATHLAIVTMIAGPIAAINGGLVLAVANGGPGTGNGVIGGAAAVVLGLAAVALGGFAMSRARIIASTRWV